MKTFTQTQIEKEMNVAKKKFKQIDLSVDADEMDFREAEVWRLKALQQLQKAIERNITQTEFNIEVFTL